MIPKEILRKIRRIEIRTRRLVADVFSGEYQSVFKGRGIEFTEVREYLPGDDIRSIDWNVTARTGHPYVKKYDEERELTIMFVVDASGSGAFGSTDRFKSELAAELCALLAFSATRNNDRVGLITFTDRIEKVVPPAKGRRHVLRVIRELLYFEPEGKGTDIPLALDYLSNVVRRHAIVFLVSDFLAKGYEKSLSVANRRYDLIAINISDPREQAFPGVGLIELGDAETGERMTVDTSDRRFIERLTEELARRREQRQQTFRRLGVDSISVSTDRPYVEPLERFFRMRARRAGPLVGARGRR
ncbi:MAG: DUF58 domain-containing protein [Candidatus Eisenbacteria bacterium]|nr:DUF58 domain-containing protein [Candidatus Eisenbacteria bacterium]